MCGCGGGQEYGHECPDCQVAPSSLGRIIGGGPGLGARWASTTNYDRTLHRRYGIGAVVPLNRTNPLLYQRPQPPGLGEVMLGSSGWALSDVASLGLIVLAGLALWKEIK